MRRALFALLLLAAPAFGQKVTIPAEARAPVGRLVAITISHDGDDCAFTASPEVDVFREYHPDPRTIKLRAIAYQEGRYQIQAISCKEKRLGEFAVCTFTAGTPIPVPPGPDPPTPAPPTPGKVAVPLVVGKEWVVAATTIRAAGLVPKLLGGSGEAIVEQDPVGGTLVAGGSTVTITTGTGPTPPTPEPAPIPVAGFRVLIVEESMDRAKLPVSQYNILFSKTIRDYLDGTCVTGADGKTKEWRIYDADVDTGGEAKHWQDAMKKPRKSLPWIIISNSPNGGYEGPLPDSVEKTITLLNRYAPKSSKLLKKAG